MTKIVNAQMFTPFLKPVGPAPPPTQGRGGNFFPNTEVISHTGKTFKFYQDLIHQKVVLINFMSIKSHQTFPASKHLGLIAAKLGKRLGKDVFLYSVSTDPENDTPQRLSHLAKQCGVRPGWLFLTSAHTKALNAVSDRLYKHKGHAGHGKGHPARLVHYGNGALGLWGAFGVDGKPELALERLSWVVEGKPIGKSLHRAGPRQLGNDYKAQNRNR